MPTTNSGRSSRRPTAILTARWTPSRRFMLARTSRAGRNFTASRTVVRECRDKLRAIVPELARVFLFSDEIVAFTPKSKEDEAGAEQATDYCNYVARADGRRGADT